MDAGYDRETNLWGGVIRTVSNPSRSLHPKVIDNSRLNLKNSSTSDGRHNDLVALNDSTYLVAYHGDNGQKDGWISSFRIKLDGQITRLDDYEHDAREAYYHKLVKVDSNTVAMAYELSLIHI